MNRRCEHHVKCNICGRCHNAGCKNFKSCIVYKSGNKNGKYKKNQLRKLTFDEEMQQDKFLTETGVIKIFES